jgi:hypothetical protein
MLDYLFLFCSLFATGLFPGLAYFARVAFFVVQCLQKKALEV